MPFLYIFLFSLISSIGTILLVSIFLLFPAETRASFSEKLLSYAFGVLIGTAFLGFLPNAVAQLDEKTVFTTVLVSIVVIFVLEKAMLHRHQHTDNGHIHFHGRNLGILIIAGDIFHNFIDGVVIATAFFSSVSLGLITSISVITHEIPHELSDYAILLENGFSRKKAFLLNMLSSLSTLAGAMLSLLFLGFLQNLVPYLMAVAAASFIYIAIGDLIPKLNLKKSVSQVLFQFLFIGLGLGTSLLLETYH